MSPKSPADRLNSWKAIARYIDRSERTARRWEAEEGMPVHRHMHQSQASVYAYPSEIDAWMVRWESNLPPAPERPVPAPKFEQGSIVVLPFDFVGSNAGDVYIADGFTDEVIADLAKISSLRIISRTSTMQLRQSSLGIYDIAKKLDVEYVLEGSVRRYDDAIKVSVRLLDPHKDHPVWSEKFSGGVQDVFEIQERIAREIAAAMRIRLTASDESRLASRDITDWSAWLAAVKARQASLRWNREGIDQAVNLLENALASSGEIACLYTALGKTYLHYRETGFDLSDRPLLEAEQCAAKAFAADPDGAGGYELLGWLNYSRGEIQQAVKNLKIAAMRKGSDPDTLGLLCNCYLISGQLPVARMLIPRIVSMDPLALPNQVLPAWADVLEGRHSGAVETYRVLLETEPDSPLFRLFLVWILSINGLTDEAVSVVDGYSSSDSESLPAQVARCFAAACRGDGPTIELSAEDRELTGINDMYPRLLAQAYALAGDANTALDWLRLAVSRGFINYPYLNEHDPVLTSLKANVGYSDLIDVVQQRWKQFEA